jgi:DNA-binding transcriptional LysR family regulator
MKINLEALQVLEAIDRCGSFALAAKDLHRVPSALTYTVSKLEEQLNISIFDRAGHRAKLTPVGKLVLDEGRKLLASADQLERRIHLHKTGQEEQLLIAYDQLIPSANLHFLLEKFFQRFPDMHVKLSGEVLGGCWDSLLSGRATIAIGVSDDPPVRDDLAVLPLGSIDFEFVVGKNHPLAQEPERLKNSDIAKHRIIAVADSTQGFIPARSTGILPEQPVLTVNTFDEKIRAILCGLGIGYLPANQAKKYIETGELIAKKVPPLCIPAALSIAWRPSLLGTAGKWLIKELKRNGVRYELATSM